jgi:hypothetical protein
MGLKGKDSDAGFKGTRTDSVPNYMKEEEEEYGLPSSPPGSVGGRSSSEEFVDIGSIKTHPYVGTHYPIQTPLSFTRFSSFV